MLCKGPVTDNSFFLCEMVILMDQISTHHFAQSFNHYWYLSKNRAEEQSCIFPIKSCVLHKSLFTCHCGTKRFMQQNCIPIVRVAPSSPIFPCPEFSFPRYQILALPSSQAIIPWATRTCNGWRHLWRLNPGPYVQPYVSCCNLCAHTTLLSVQIAEW